MTAIRGFPVRNPNPVAPNPSGWPTTRLLLAKEQLRYLFFQTLLGYEHHPRAVNLLIYSRRFLEFCQPRPQSALVLFTLLVVCSRLSRIFVPIRLLPFVSFLFSFFFFLSFPAPFLLVPSSFPDNVIAVSLLASFFFFLPSFCPSSKNPPFPRFCFSPRFDAIPLPSPPLDRATKKEYVSFRGSSHERGWPAPRIYKIRHDRAVHSPRNYLFRGMYAADRI